jgi:hypothetical protein
MRVLILSAWEDTGGVGISLKRALEKHTDWDARFVHRHRNYIGYETDIYWEPGEPKPSGLDDLFRDADIVHVMERWSAVEPFDGWRDKPLVMHHHGTEFRSDKTEHLLGTVSEYGATGIVSTIDLTLIDSTLEWLPNPCDIKYLKSLRKSYTPNRYPRVAHSPTNRSLKATDVFLRAAKTYQHEMGVDLIEWTGWESCLARKAQAEIFFDQLHIGYALSGIEAMAMNIPVIGGAYDGRIIDLMRSEFGYLPFALATTDTLVDVLGEMLDPDVRKDWGMVGRIHVQKYHDEAKVAKQLVGIYQRALDER